MWRGVGVQIYGSEAGVRVHRVPLVQTPVNGRMNEP